MDDVRASIYYFPRWDYAIVSLRNDGGIGTTSISVREGQLFPLLRAASKGDFGAWITTKAKAKGLEVSKLTEAELQTMIDEWLAKGNKIEKCTASAQPKRNSAERRGRRVPKLDLTLDELELDLEAVA